MNLSSSIETILLLLRLEPDGHLRSRGDYCAEPILHRANARIQATLLPSSFVRVNQTFRGRRVNNRYSFFVRLLCFRLIAFFDGFNRIFYMSSQARAQTDILLSSRFCLSRAFSRRCTISQKEFLDLITFGRRTMGFRGKNVNPKSADI